MVRVTGWGGRELASRLTPGYLVTDTSDRNPQLYLPPSLHRAVLEGAWYQTKVLSFKLIMDFCNFSPQLPHFLTFLNKGCEKSILFRCFDGKQKMESVNWA